MKKVIMIVGRSNDEVGRVDIDYNGDSVESVFNSNHLCRYYFRSVT